MDIFLRRAVYDICLIILCHLPLSLSAFQDQQHFPLLETPAIYRIAPSPGNPRNSEGDFVTLKDNKLLFVYSRYTGHIWIGQRHRLPGGKNIPGWWKNMAVRR